MTQRLAFPFSLESIETLFAQKDLLAEVVAPQYKSHLYSGKNKWNSLACVESPLQKLTQNAALHQTIKDIAVGLIRGLHLQSYALPDDQIKDVINPADFEQDTEQMIAQRKHWMQIVIQQAASWIIMLFRLSHQFIHNKHTQQAMYTIGRGPLQVGLYRVTMKCDLSDPTFQPYLHQFRKLFVHQQIEQHLPLVFILLLTRESIAFSDIHVRHVQNLSSEFGRDIEPIITSEDPRAPVHSFWTIHHRDSGLEDFAARVVLNTFPDFFPLIDSDTLWDLWRYKEINQDMKLTLLSATIGKDIASLIREKHARFQQEWDDLTDVELKQIMDDSSYARCSLLAAKTCLLPLPLFVRRLFQTKGIDETSYTKSVITYFVFSAYPNMKTRYPQWTALVFAQEKKKQFFPASGLLCAYVYHIIVAWCLRMHKSRLEWTNKKYESVMHPSPWQILMEKAMDVNEPRTALANFSGFRRFIQHMDLTLLSFVGGYIMHSNDQVCAVYFRKLRIGLLRMGYLQSDHDYDSFVAGSNSSGLIQRHRDLSRANIIGSFET